MIVGVERHRDQALVHHGQDQCGIPEVKRALGQDCLAGEEGLGHALRDSEGPRMVPVSGVREGHEEPGVGDALHGRANPFREDRSFGPRIFPASRMNGRRAAPDFAIAS